VGCGRNLVTTRFALGESTQDNEGRRTAPRRFLSDVGFSHIPHLTSANRTRQKKNCPRNKVSGAVQRGAGDGLLSRALSSGVPSAL
jgi:hypothetical protein